MQTVVHLDCREMEVHMCVCLHAFVRVCLCYDISTNGPVRLLSALVCQLPRLKIKITRQLEEQRCAQQPSN